MRFPLRLVAIALIGLAAIGCTSTPSPAPTEAAIAAPTADELDAIRLRTEFGLRADLAYVRAVAGNPAASSAEFSIPLLPAEIAELNARAANADAIVEAINAYADLHKTEFAGLYLDQKNGGAVTTRWTAHLDEHMAAIRALVRPGARIAFGPATFTLADLEALQERISADMDWMRADAIVPQGVGVDVFENHVLVVVSSANGAARALITAHYAAPPGMIEVELDGTGAALIPEGIVRGRVLDSRGKPPGNDLAGELSLSWTSDGPGDCGGDGVGHGVEASGRFELPCQAGGHTISIEIAVPDQDSKTIGSGHVVAIGHETVGLEIRLDEPWPPAGMP